MAKKNLKPEDDLDLTGWNEAKDEATQLTTSQGPAKTQMQECEDAYFLHWKNKPKSDEVKSTISPAPRIKVQGAQRLLTATAPTWELPKAKNGPDAEQASNKLEQYANTMWLRSNHVQQMRVEEDLALSAFLYDEIQARVISTADLLESVKAGSAEAQEQDDYDENKWENEIDFAQAVADRTPYLYESVYPITGYYLKSRLGLEVHYTETEMMVADIVAQWGQRARAALGTAKSYHVKTVCEWWDKTYHYVWPKGSDPFIAGKHELKIIPIVVVRVEGSALFPKPERQNEPFLFTVLRSGLIERQNEMLTVLYTNMAALLNAQFVHKKGNDQAKAIDINHNVRGGVIEVEPSGDLQPMAKNIFDPSLEKGLQLIDTLFDQSTIYAQALGGQVARSDNFSLVSLLQQAGRLPLVPTQEALKTVFAGLMEISFKWLKQSGKTAKYDYGELDPAEIPDRLEFTVHVDVDLPQDKLTQATIAEKIAVGPDPLVSKEWARVNVLNEGQSDDLQKQIWSEQAAGFAFQNGMRGVVMAVLQKIAGMMQPKALVAPTPPPAPIGPGPVMPPTPPGAGAVTPPGPPETPTAMPTPGMPNAANQ